MPRLTETLTRHQLLLFEGDFEKLNSFYQHRSATEVIRTLVRRHIESIEIKLRETEDA
jgi:hypothetical protein